MLNGVNQPMNILFQDVVWWSLGIVAMLILLVRIWELFKAHLRHVSAMSTTAQQQIYWAENSSSWYPWVKKHILYAPLGSKRHNREFQISKAVNMGTLPSRFHAILLLGYLISNLVYTFVLDWTREDRFSTLAELRGRSGVLAVVNMIPLIMLAGRNNPLIPMLKISFDTYNLLHRWMGRLVVLEACLHTLAWAIVEVADKGWDGVKTKVMTNNFLGYGMVGTVAMVLILFQSPSIFRHAFYETFLTVHIILAIAAIVGVYVHLHVAGLPQLPYLQAMVVLWATERFARFYRLVSCNYSARGWTRATVEAMPGDTCRVTMHLPKHLYVAPGSHAYLRFAKVNMWESHPFSIAWTADQPILGTKDLLPSPATMSFSSSASTAINEKVSASYGMMKRSELKTDVSFIISAQTGMTRKLFNLASAHQSNNLTLGRPLVLKAALEGPYGGHHSLSSYGHVLLFACASGITHQIPYLKQLIMGHHTSTVATRRIVLVWTVRDTEHLEWVRPWMDEILRLPGRRDCLTVKVFVTRPKRANEITSPSSTVRMYPGRPNVIDLVDMEMKERVGAMAVTVCGPGGFADNVRQAVRGAVEEGVVDFIEESFTW